MGVADIVDTNLFYSAFLASPFHCIIDIRFGEWEDPNVIDYSNNESSKLLQSQYVAKLGTIVESFGVMFTEE